MAIVSRKINAFTKTVSQLADRPGGTVPTADLKAQFDGSPEELRVAHNGLIDDLSSTTAGASGAHQIASETITGVTGDTVYAQMSSIKSQVDGASLGQIPDGSLTKAKMTTTVQASLDKADAALPKAGGTLTGDITVPDPAGGTISVQGLKSSVDSGKTDIKTAIIGKGGTVAGTSPHSFAELVAGINLLGNIKTQQRGTITLNGATSGTATISAVNPANAILELTWYADAVPADQICPAGEITNGTTLTFNKNTSTGSVVIEWVVTEFYNVKSKQTGTASVNATSVTATVSAVNPAKCKLFASFTTTNTTTGNNTMNYTLTNSTTITFKQQVAVIKNTKWQLIEFN